MRETQLRKDIQALTDTVHDRSQQVIDLKDNVKHDEAEIQRLDGLRIQLTQTVKTNEMMIDRLDRDLEKATNDLDRAEHQIGIYKDAIQTANDNLRKQNDLIERQNQEMTKLTEDRNEIVKKYNKMAAEDLDLANKWNQQQEELAKAATNAPPKK